MAEFYHHGVKGQKWGVRRYRNADGSLTPAGKKRAAKLNAEIEKRYNKEYGKASKTVGKISDKIKREGRSYGTAKEAYKADLAANKMLKAKLLREKRLSEVKEKLTYYEKTRRNEIIATAAVLPLAAATGGPLITRRTISPYRRELNRQYRSANRSAKKVYKARVKSEKTKKKMVRQAQKAAIDKMIQDSKGR